MPLLNLPKFWTLPFFWGVKFWTVISAGGQFTTLLFSIVAHSETPCIDLTIGVATSVAFTVQDANRI